jgi:hypothetical protein
VNSTDFAKRIEGSAKLRDTASRWYHRRDELAPRPRPAYVLVDRCTLFVGQQSCLGRRPRDDIGPFTLTAARITVAGVVFTALLRRSLP